MGLGITRLSIVSAVCEDTGDDSLDAVVKVRRLVNRRGRSFCDIADWPFKRTDISFSITSAAYKYSGASYLPTTFKKPIAAFLIDQNDRHPLTEVGILRAYEWKNPDENSGRPDEFCITRVESGYWEIQFNRLPDATYTVYMEIEQQWTDLTADNSETIITNDYYDGFVLYCDIERFKQQGDAENYSIAKDDWFNPMKPKDSMLTRLLEKLSSASKKRSVTFDRIQAGLDPYARKSDYDRAI